MKTGMHKHTGETITGVEFLNQRFVDAFSTRKGSLVVDREYGTYIDDLIDENITPLFRMQLFARAAETIKNPVNGLDDVKLKQLELIEQADNSVEVVVYMQWENQEVTTRVTLLEAA
ncbi:hypothetical protein AB835_11670 [Candidatus Endobugula sertula]|uniref:IraD/Gp25-like domain-containing protein n=1 Tax=Candidatus Endobugula sertula TaxID=62101 RepID=A0A1D2QMW4_9GAMM|nr:hypothetical protein AB835_11670 [Candidatus Endobugula sertula]